MKAVRPFLPAAFLLLGAGLWGGLLRIGWTTAVPLAPWISNHGLILVSGFLGTLISLERAVGLRRPWAFGAAALSLAGGILLLFESTAFRALELLVAASLWLLLLDGASFHLAPMGPHALQTAGALSWLFGNLAWIGAPGSYAPRLFFAAFPVLTVVGERLDRMRFLQPSARAKGMLLAALAPLAAGLALVWVNPAAGVRWAAAGFLGLALWFFWFDLPRRFLREAGFPHYQALALLSGYAWLAAAGALGLLLAPVERGLSSDAFLHAVFLGFTFSMIFAHGPLLLPALLSWRFAFTRALFLPLGLLHASLVLRVAGDLLEWIPARRWGGAGGAGAILLFFVLLAFSLGRGFSAFRERGPARSQTLPEGNETPSDAIR